MSFDRLSYLLGIDLLEGIKILQYHLQGQMCLAHIDDLHGLSMMRSSRICRLHSSTEEVFYSAKDEGSVENSIDLDAEEGRGYLLSQTLWRDVSANVVRLW